MHRYLHEFTHAYATYSFGYTVHGNLEPEEPLDHAYEEGFLPASSDPAVHNRFYMARSTRVILADHTPSSENRRILKKFDGVFEREMLSREELLHDPNFRPCFLSYFADRHGQSIMSEERLEGILACAHPLRGVRYTQDGEIVGYVLLISGEGFIHYWFSAYTPAYVSSSLGMWLMLDMVRYAQESSLTHLYLGTAYGEKGKYKMNISPLEFWNGTKWNADEGTLKTLISCDHDREVRTTL